MTKAAGSALLLALVATPALAAGPVLEGEPWWMVIAFLAFHVPLIALVAFVFLGFGFFLHGLRWRNALLALTFVAMIFLAGLVASYGIEKMLDAVPLLAFFLTFFGPFFGLGWYLRTREINLQSDRKITLNAGSNHG